MAIRRNNGEDISDSVGLLTSILVCYPEVGTIKYEPQKHLLKLTFMLHKVAKQEEWADFRKELAACLEAFYRLEGQRPLAVEFDYMHFQGLTVIEIQRDVETLSQREISLIIGLTREFFGADLVAEEDDLVLEEELWGQEELIGYMLENMKGAIPNRRLIAFREQGRVLVFNK